jgi:hypothetical protein
LVWLVKLEGKVAQHPGLRFRDGDPPTAGAAETRTARAAMKPMRTLRDIVVPSCSCA